MEPALSRLSPKRRDMHLPIMEILTGFRLAESLALLIRTPAALGALLRGLPDMGAPRRRERYLERVRHRGPLDRRGANRLDAAAADHPGEGRSTAI